MDPSSLLQQLETWAKNPPRDILTDEAVRPKLRDAARNLSIAMENPGDTVHRIGFLHLQTAMARIGIELNLFQILTKNGDVPVNTKTLAEQTGVDPVLMGRFLKYYASFAMIEEVGEDQFIASSVSTALVPPGLEGGIKCCFEMGSKGFAVLPRFLRETNYKNISDPTHCPWHLAQNTTQSPFSWLQSNPTHMNDFLLWMTAQREGSPTWLEVFPFEKKLCENLDPETPLFVDIGGAVGHQCVALKAKHPHVQGRIILQDRPHVIEHAIPAEGVEAMAYDFWTPQPIKGARAYYIRNVLHNWPDDKCIQILKNTLSAMTSDSVILIDEMIMPDTSTHWRAAQLDLLMMALLAAQERTKKQWDYVLEAAGLEIQEVYTYTDELQDSIIVAVPRGS